MSDTFGALSLPLATPAAGETVGDPLLGVTLSFFAAVLNASAPAAWRAVYKDVPLAAVVKRVFPTNAQKTSFTNAELPALFLFRESVSDPERIAEDWLTRESILRLWWIPPVAIIDKRELRSAMNNAIATVLLAAVERNRDPAWKVVGDLDPRAAAEGSDFSAFAGWMEFTIGAWKPDTLVLQVTGETSSQTADQPRYEGLSLACKVTERLVEDLGRYAPTQTTRLTVQTPDGLVLGVSDLT